MSQVKILVLNLVFDIFLLGVLITTKDVLLTALVAAFVYIFIVNPWKENQDTQDRIKREQEKLIRKQYKLKLEQGEIYDITYKQGKIISMQENLKYEMRIIKNNLEYIRKSQIPLVKNNKVIKLE